MNFLNDIHSQMKNMSVQDLENFCIQTISDCISAHSEIQELHNLTSATKKAQRSLKSKCKMLEAQCQRFERILDSVDNDEDDEVKIYAEPMKIKRSVGLQVDIRRNIDNFKLNNDEEQAPDKQIVETMSSDTAVPEKQVMQTMSSHTINEHSTLEPVNSNSIVKSVTQPPSHLSETLLPIKQCDINNNNTLKELVKEEKTSKYLSTASVQKIGELEGIPPVPFLKITQDVESIALAWNLNLSPSIAKIAYYELFVYHEKDPKIKDWKKIGHFRALPLPMGCTLSQIGKGNKYYFAVRAVDIHSRKGPFSRPVSTSQHERRKCMYKFSCKIMTKYPLLTKYGLNHTRALFYYRDMAEVYI